MRQAMAATARTSIL